MCVCLYVNPSHCLKCKFALIIRSFSSEFYGVLFCSFRSPSSFFFIKLCGYCWVFLWYFGVFFWSFSVSLVISGGIIWWHVCVGVVFMSWLMGFKFPPKVTIHPSSPSSSLTKLKMEKFSLFFLYTVRSNMAFSFVVVLCFCWTFMLSFDVSDIFVLDLLKFNTCFLDVYNTDQGFPNETKES